MSAGKRYVFLVEMTVDGPLSVSALERNLTAQFPDARPVVWGVIDGVDAAYRKLRQLAAETEREDSLGNRIHSAHKALAFFRDIFPASFWTWKMIGGDHPTDAERPNMAGR